MTERDYSEFSPAELNREFLKIFEMLPRDYVAEREGPRQSSELRDVVAKKLEDLLEHSFFSLSCVEFFCDRYAEYSVSGLNESNNEKRKFVELIDFIRVSGDGIRNIEISGEIEFKAFELQLERLQGLEKQRFVSAVDREQKLIEINRVKDELAHWREDYIDIHGGELVLPKSV